MSGLHTSTQALATDSGQYEPLDAQDPNHQAKYPHRGAWGLGELSSGPSQLPWLLQEKIYAGSRGNKDGVV